MTVGEKPASGQRAGILFVLSTLLRTRLLERRADGQAEGLTRFAQDVIRSVELQRLLVAVGTSAGQLATLAWECTVVREQVLKAVGGVAGAGVGQGQLLRQVLVEAKRVVRVVEAERSVDDRQDHLQLGTVGHAGNECSIPAPSSDTAGS